MLGFGGVQVRDSGLLDGRLTNTAVDLVFSRVKAKARPSAAVCLPVSTRMPQMVLPSS